MQTQIILTIVNSEGSDILVKFDSTDPGTVVIEQGSDNLYVRAALVEDLLRAIVDGGTKAKSLAKAFNAVAAQ